VRLFIRMGAKSELELFSTLARLWLGLGGACDDFNRDVELWLERLRHRPQITRLALRLKHETVRQHSTSQRRFYGTSYSMLEPWGGALASGNWRF
jgi:hypothetical protein